MMNKKQLKRAYGLIDEINRVISSNEKKIMEINKNIQLAEVNNDFHYVTNLEDIKRKYKANNRQLRQCKKELMQTMTIYAEEIDKNTVNAESNKPLTREKLMAKYRVTDTFKDVTLNSINEDLPFKLSSKALNKVILEVFPEVKSRRITGDIKYNLELII